VSVEPPHAFRRAAISLGVGAAMALALTFATPMPATFSLLVGWEAGGLTLLSLSWLTIASCSAQATQIRAAADDPGRTAVYLIVVLTSGASLLATTALVHRARAIAGGRADALVALSLANVMLCWALTHTAFSLRYAHLYYREDTEGVGGVDFPGTPAPSYFDFAYFAFTVGMTFQVSDTTVSSVQIRRAVLLHAVLSFIYNTAILAFVLNLVFGVAV
jgi:uncharacterized membrane protein